MLNDADLLKIRDEIGDTEPPTDDDLADMYDERGSWISVALAVLKRRRASLASGSAGLTIPGVIAIEATRYGDIGAVDNQIARLEGLLLAQTRDYVRGRLRRRDIAR